MPQRHLGILTAVTAVCSFAIATLFASHLFGQGRQRIMPLRQAGNQARLPSTHVRQANQATLPVVQLLRHARSQRSNDANQQQPGCAHRPVQPPVYQPVPQPFYSQPVYSQPVYPHSIAQPSYLQPVTTPSAPSAAERLVIEMNQKTADAKRRFASANYVGAKKILDEVVQAMPKNTDACQFRSLAAFAMGDYKSAAADAYDLFSLGNSWTQGTVKSLYGTDPSRYSTHLDNLIANAKAAPSMQNHFLLAYHFMMAESWAASKNELEQVLSLQPAEPLTMKLMNVVNQKIAEQVGMVGAN